jgi:pimeloyl-ACP methyl ester carboxylesterase
MTHPPAAELHRCHHDPRFSFALALPAPGRAPPRGFVVAIHDSERKHEVFATGFADFARDHRFAILSPVFPVGVLGDGNPDGYKFLHEKELRYDALLNTMLAQAADLTGARTPTIVMHGYSGGAQFAHRYLLLHPQRLAAVSIASPGEVTLPDDELPWWGGVANTQALFGQPVDWQAVAQVDIHLSVGEEDVSTEPLKEQPPSHFWRDDAERLASHRKDRLATLRDAWAEVGIDGHLELLPGVAHGDGHRSAMARAAVFFQRCLRGTRRPVAGVMARSRPVAGVMARSRAPQA